MLIVCFRCKEEKEIYTEHKSCVECRKKQMEYFSDPDIRKKNAQKAKEWRAKNKERYNKTCKLYYSKPEKALKSKLKKKEWYDKNKERLNNKSLEVRILERENARVRNFKDCGYTFGYFNELLKQQNNKCSICGISHEENQLVMDHNHESNKLRGLLCDKCNRGLGHFNDNIEMLNKAIEYIKKHKCLQ